MLQALNPVKFVRDAGTKWSALSCSWARHITPTIKYVNGNGEFKFGGSPATDLGSRV